MTPRTALAMGRLRLGRLFSGIRPGALARAISAGLVVGIIMAMKTISLASLVFADTLAPMASRGIGLALLGALVLGIAITLSSSFGGMIASAQEAPVAILALMAATIVSSMPATATPEQIFVTALAAVVLTSLLSGVFFFTLGTLRIGGMVRYVPYPVVGGFLAASGWLLVKGALGLMAGSLPDPTHLAAYLQPDALIRWLPGIAFALMLMAALNRSSHYLVFPGVLLGGVTLFYLALWLTHTPVAEASNRAWLLGPFPAGGLWRSIDFGGLNPTQVYWPSLTGNIGHVLAILVTGVIALLLNASGLELAIERDLDLNRELQSAGIGNVAAGLSGGLVGFQSLSLSLMAHKLGVRSRLIGVLATLVCGIPLFLNASLLSLLPRAIVGGLLMMLGLSFLFEWLYKSWFRLPKLDYMVIVLILVTSATVGFLEGIGVGLIAALALFVIDYSRVKVVKHALTGANRQSTFTRSKSERQFLIREGAQLYILELQGFIFFGTASRLLGQIRERMAQSAAQAIRYVLLDFRQVTGLDSSALFSFVKLKQIAHTGGIILVLTYLAPDVQHQFAQTGLADVASGPVRVFGDLDHGIEWCEDQIIGNAGPALVQSQHSLIEQLGDALQDPHDFGRLLAYLDKQDVGAGHYLMRQGDQPDVLYFLETGKVTAQLERPGRAAVRLQTMAGENIVGEIGLYLGITRTASVITDEPSTVYGLSSDALQRMEQQDPDLAAAVHKYVARLMAERLVHLTRTVDAVMS